MRRSVLVATVAGLLTWLMPGRLLAQEAWTLGPWTRASSNPVISPQADSTFQDPLTGKTVHWEALHTFNPAAIVRDGKIIVLYRAEDDSGEMAIGGHTSRLGMAISDDGIHFRRMPEPVFFPARDDQAERETPGGVEDPRLVEAPDGSYVLTYTQWSRTTRRFTIGVATSRDLQHWTKFGPIFGPSDKGTLFKYKSSGIVTSVQGGRLIATKVRGMYWMYWGEGEIHLANSNDLIHWRPVQDEKGAPEVLLRRRPGKSDSDFPETGPPAILTAQGIVLLYNAKNASGENSDQSVGAHAYTVQEALFSSDIPDKLLARTDKPVLQPALLWEKSGQYVAGTTFGEGLVLFHSAWWLYYGSADSFVGVATAPYAQQGSQTGEGTRVPADMGGAVSTLITPAVAPDLTTPPEQLTPAQVARMQRKLKDWAQLARYRDANTKLTPPAKGEQRVVFLGDSIIDGWGHQHAPLFFPGKPYLDRGISGQTTGQMLVRFQQDVVDLQPAAVVILAGINDIAGNDGPEALSQIEDNFRAMATLAKAAHIRVVLSSVMPASYFPWHKGVAPGEEIRALNTWLQAYAGQEQMTYLDFYTALVNSTGGMREQLAADKAVHPNDAGYSLMQPLAEAAIENALSRPRP